MSNYNSTYFQEVVDQMEAARLYTRREVDAAMETERERVLAELWAWLERMPETYDFQALGEKLSEMKAGVGCE